MRSRRPESSNTGGGARSRRSTASLYLRRIARWAIRRPASSSAYARAPAQEATRLARGWQDPELAVRQRELVERQLRDLRRGRAPEVFEIGARAVDALGAGTLSLLEIGCASGYYAEVFRHLAKTDVEYYGLDYSPSLLSQAKEMQPGISLMAGDAARLPLADAAVSLAFSAAVLMHVPDWRAALAECARVSRDAVVLHRTPVTTSSRTALLKKLAYGVDVPEILFNERELLSCCKDVGLNLQQQWVIARFKIRELGEAGIVKTYLFRKAEGDVL